MCEQCKQADQAEKLEVSPVPVRVAIQERTVRQGCCGSAATPGHHHHGHSSSDACCSDSADTDAGKAAPEHA